MWGIIPAAGNGLRIQPLAFSKELLPVGARRDAHGVERPRAVSEYLVERMINAGATKICFVISPWKSDILQYFGGTIGDVGIAYVIQNQASGLCDAIFRALTLVHPDEPVVVGLPDTIWFPEHALRALPDDRLAFLLFEVARPELFDAVVVDADGTVREIQVKSAQARSRWVWGAFRMPGHVLHALHALWLQRGRRDEYVGTLVNAWLAAGGTACGVRAGTSYVDVGTLGGYREAVRLLGDEVGHANPSWTCEPGRLPGVAGGLPLETAMEPMKPMRPMAPMEPMKPMAPMEWAKSEPWWPADLGTPSSTGAQNGMRYAFFPAARRLLVERAGERTTYDTGDHRITGASQADAGTQTLAFTTADGPVPLEALAQIR